MAAAQGSPGVCAGASCGLGIKRRVPYHGGERGRCTAKTMERINRRGKSEPLPLASAPSASVAPPVVAPMAPPTCPTGMAQIPGGKFFMGSDDKDDAKDDDVNEEENPNKFYIYAINTSGWSLYVARPAEVANLVAGFGLADSGTGGPYEIEPPKPVAVPPETTTTTQPGFDNGGTTTTTTQRFFP